MRILSKTIFLTSVPIAYFLITFTAHATDYAGSILALSVYPGCEKVTSVKEARTFYVDPVNGLDTNDGSLSKPWRSLTKLVNTNLTKEMYVQPFSKLKNGASKVVNPNAVVKSGDTILLMNGNYGDVLLEGINTSFVTIKAAPRQTPTFTRIEFRGANRWVVSGVKVLATPPVPTTPNFREVVSIRAHGWVGPNDNIIFDRNKVAAAEGYDFSKYTQDDWVSKIKGFGIRVIGGSEDLAGPNPLNGGCISVINNHISYVSGGGQFLSNRSMFSGNTTDMFGGHDNLSVNGHNILISKNRATNAVDIPGTAMHMDFIQGQVGYGGSNSNIVIDRNVFIRKTDPRITARPATQGIVSFDSNWSNVQITNNFVVTDSFHGITWGSVNGLDISNNTVFNDGLTANKLTWILMDTKGRGQLSANATIRNNLSTHLVMNFDTTSLTATNNVTERFDYNQQGRWFYQKTPGMYLGNSVVANAKSFFVDFDPSRLAYNFSRMPNMPHMDVGAPSYNPPLSGRSIPNLHRQSLFLRISQ